jgi:putative ABC transport system ATP-binding protein
MGLVRLRRVYKAYLDGRRRHDVLAGVDLDVSAGELVALLGPSGAGKTTVLNVVAGIDRADAGTVEVGGTELGSIDERGRTLLRRRQIGLVFQFFNLVPTLTILENIMLPLELIGGITRASMHDEALSLLEQIGLADRGDAYADELSGGEQQRVAIARALAHRPALVLADEPTGNLDSVTGARVLDLLTGMVSERGTAMLIATHAPEVVERAARVLTLRDGVIAAP